ncbi:MAG: hypothetical protein K2Q01_11315, partial [Rickettsiales bacterium]|nr:hypothetical protein [Rickettsiales bacterium]
EKLENEFSAIGFYLSSHPLSGYSGALESMKVLTSSRFAEKLGSQYKGVRVAGIVTGRKFKASDKGRFAFVQLSDMGGIFEVSIFDETLLSQQRDLLENGKILLITADAKMDDSGPRLIAQSLSLFDDALMRQQQMQGNLSSFRIVVNKPDAVPLLRGLLGEANGKGAKVVLCAEVEQQRADIQLPGKYSISPTILDKIRVLKGVVAAEEIAS